MQEDDEICYCHHVSLRKLLNYARRVRPVHASQMAECLGAGTGCGWCIPFLVKIARAGREGSALELGISPADYAAARRVYRACGARNRWDGGDLAPDATR